VGNAIHIDYCIADFTTIAESIENVTFAVKVMMIVSNFRIRN
jgi:hypothetical protein